VDSITGPLFYSFLTSLLVSMSLIPVFMSTAGRLHFLDYPGDRKVHALPIARVGGIAFASGAAVGILLWKTNDPLIMWTLLGSLVLLLFGIWDDRVGLSHRTKFLGQCLAAAVVVLGEAVRLDVVPFTHGDALPWWAAVPLTMFVIVGVTNAVNMADGLDGLAGGLSLLSFAGMAALAYGTGDYSALLIASAILGGLLGFLRFNTFPARVFMGDAGSQFLGFVLGIVAISLSNSARGGYAPTLSLLLIGLPILDALGVMLERRRAGMSMFVGDKRHVHHKLLAIGCTHRETVILIYGLQALMVASAYFLRWHSDWHLITAYVLLALPVAGLFAIFAWGELRWTRAGSLHPAPAGRSGVDASPQLSERILPMMEIGIWLFLLIGVLLPREVPRDFGLLALAWGGVLAIGYLTYPRGWPLLIRGGLYVGTAFVLFLSERAPIGQNWPTLPILNVFFLGMALLVVLAMRVRGETDFQTTPLDWLMIIVVAAAMSLADLTIGDTRLAPVLARMMVLFFAYEVLLQTRHVTLARWRWLSLWVLVGLGVRAWL
jgi:UDP-GlcNAc:undecaprenyl-phosphate GlcNAc-1-phosphate transferase